MTAPRKTVQWFARQMEAKLRENDHKGGWDDCELGWLLRRLGQEVGELRRALKKEKHVVREAADVANFAMMIADVWHEYELEQEP